MPIELQLLVWAAALTFVQCVIAVTGAFLQVSAAHVLQRLVSSEELRKLIIADLELFLRLHPRVGVENALELLLATVLLRSSRRSIA